MFYIDSDTVKYHIKHVIKDMTEDDIDNMIQKYMLKQILSNYSQSQFTEAADGG